MAAFNKGYENDPELGVLLPGAPCSNCYELMDKRTEYQKYFVQAGTNAQQFVLQSSNVPLHYKDATGKWRNVSDKLEADATHSGVYSTKGRPINISVNTQDGAMTLTGAAASLSYNRNLELVYRAADGSEHSLGLADWSHTSRGDDGMLVKNAWPGVDIEIGVLVNSVKTNFIVNHSIPAYADGQLLVRDHLKTDAGTHMSRNTGTFTDDLKVQDKNGNDLYIISKAVAYERNNPTASKQDLSYTLHNDNTTDIVLPGTMLNKPADAYPLVIDPLVSGTATAGFTYSSILTISYCTITNSVLIPAAATLSDIQVNFNYYGVAFASWFHAEWKANVGGLCETNWKYCSSGTADGIGAGHSTCGTITPKSFWSASTGLGNWGDPGCLPAYSCSSYTLPFHILTTQDYANHGSCEQTVFATASGVTIDVYGSVTSTPTVYSSATSICAGGSTTLTASPAGGNWTSSNTAVATVGTSGIVTTIAPGTTAISYTVAGYCNPAVTNITVVTTPTASPISAPTTSVCAGSTITLTEATAGGTWGSSNPTIAPVSGGIVTGAASGTATITYSITNACSTVIATTNVIAHALPDAGTIAAPAMLCIPTAATLSNSVSGGTWSSSNTSVATIGSSDGITNGVTDGTTTISYVVSDAYCTNLSTVNITVGSTPSPGTITGSTTMCQGTADTLTNTAPLGIWSSSNPAIASVDASTGIVSAYTPGTATISYSISSACGTGAIATTVNVMQVFTYNDVINTIAGNGTSGTFGDGGLATSAQIGLPFGVSCDAAGNLYFVDDMYNAVRKVSTSGTISHVAGVYTTTPVSLGDGGSALLAHLASPTGLVIAPDGTIYICEYAADKIRKISPSGIISTFASVNTPRGICRDAAGNLYVTSEAYHIIMKVSPSGVATAFAGNGIPAYSGDGGDALSASLFQPTGVCADASGNVYIADNGNAVIRKVDAAGIITTFAGNGTFGFSGDGGPAINAELAGPNDIAIDHIGNLYFAEYGSKTIRKINLSSGIINTIAGTGVPSFMGDGVPAVTANIDPNFVTIGPDNSVYLSDYANVRIRKIVNGFGSTITGSTSVCTGNTATLSDLVMGGTGTWTSSNPAIATVGTSGLVTGMTTGTTTIDYSVANACSSDIGARTMTVLTVPTAGSITSTDTAVCIGSIIHLADATSGGTWGNTTGNATVSAGAVTGMTAGTDTIKYTVTNSCGTAVAAYKVTIVDCTPPASVSTTGAVHMYINPNPNNGTFNLYIPAASTAQANVLITDVAGREVLHTAISTNSSAQLQLPVAPGIYLLQATAGNDRYTAKIVVQ